MDFSKIKNKGQARLFRNDYVEKMTKTHPVVVYCMYFPLIIFMLYYGNVYRGLSAGYEAILFFSGILLWTLFEYPMHRYLFHMTVESERGKKIAYIIHGVHHEFPRDKERLFMPLSQASCLAISPMAQCIMQYMHSHLRNSSRHYGVTIICIITKPLIKALALAPCFGILYLALYLRKRRSRCY